MARRKGIPAIRQRKDKNGKKLDLWECLINNGRDPATGKPKRIPIYGKHRRNADRRLLKPWPVFKIRRMLNPIRPRLNNGLIPGLRNTRKAISGRQLTAAMSTLSGYISSLTSERLC